MMRHLACGEPVEIRLRTIITRPDDVSWPKNCEVQVAYCTTCRCFVAPALLTEASLHDVNVAETNGGR